MKRGRIGVFPAHELYARPRLFAALAEAYPVSFESPSTGWDELDGVLLIGPQPPPGLPTGLPCLQALGEERPRGAAPAPLALADDTTLARPLRGAALTDSWTGPLPSEVLVPGALTLATTAGGAPAWVASGGANANELIAAAPAELAESESLRERLSPGRCLALLALIHFLQCSTGGEQRLTYEEHRPTRGKPPQALPLRAAFVLDDPNLHWPTYGHLRYEQLARHALEHGYHMVVAMAPLDGWFAHPRAVRIFREYPAQLSICVHGNDHLGPELGRISSDGEGLALARQALARAAAFQQRTGLAVERVMVPPHEQLSEPAGRGLLAGGFGAVCVSRPYPWIAPPSREPAAALGAGPPARGALAGWAPCEIVAGGLPVLLRAGFNAPREDLVLRAFLGQPLILYGHHDLLEHGLDVLADATAAIDALGEVRWSSLGGIAHAAAETLPSSHGAPPVRPLTPTPPDSGLTPRPRLRPLLRRLASEARDRSRLS